MEVHGSIEELKKVIEGDYRKKIREVNSHKRAQIREIEKKAKQERALLQRESKQEIDSKAGEAKAMVLNEQKLAAKRRFEEAREAMIQQVMNEARKGFPRLMKSKQYLDFVKKKVPSGCTVYGNAFFKKHFKNIKAEKDLNGVRFEKGAVIYDLSLDALFEAKEDAIREKVIEALW